MSQLIPRLSFAEAEKRLQSLSEAIRAGKRGEELPDYLDLPASSVGGLPAADIEAVRRWRIGVMSFLSDCSVDDKPGRDRYSIELGRAIDQVIAPVPADAAHDEVWSFLALNVFPDVVFNRWCAADEGSPELRKDRWIGGRPYRDRNYLKTSWRRWRLLGDSLFEVSPLLGEDELVAITERTAVARNRVLVGRIVAQIAAFPVGESELSRSEFVRGLMKHVSFMTGSLLLDTLDVGAQALLVEEAAHQVFRRQPRRAMPS